MSQQTTTILVLAGLFLLWQRNASASKRLSIKEEEKAVVAAAKRTEAEMAAKDNTTAKNDANLQATDRTGSLLKAAGLETTAVFFGY